MKAIFVGLLVMFLLGCTPKVPDTDPVEVTPDLKTVSDGPVVVVDADADVGVDAAKAD